MKPTHAAAALLASLTFAAASSSARADGDPVKGKAQFAQCRACHKVGPDATNSIGPVLNGVVGRKAGTYPGYSYSDANKNSGLTWDEATLKEYLKNPAAKVPGTKMMFPGIKQENRIDDIIAYLKGVKADGSGAE